MNIQDKYGRLDRFKFWEEFGGEEYNFSNLKKEQKACVVFVDAIITLVTLIFAPFVTTFFHRSLIKFFNEKKVEQIAPEEKTAKKVNEFVVNSLGKTAEMAENSAKNPGSHLSIAQRLLEEGGKELGRSFFIVQSLLNATPDFFKQNCGNSIHKYSIFLKDLFTNAETYSKKPQKYDGFSFVNILFDFTQIGDDSSTEVGHPMRIFLESEFGKEGYCRWVKSLGREPTMKDLEDEIIKQGHPFEPPRATIYKGWCESHWLINLLIKKMGKKECFKWLNEGSPKSLGHLENKLKRLEGDGWEKYEHGNQNHRPNKEISIGKLQRQMGINLYENFSKKGDSLWEDTFFISDDPFFSNGRCKIFSMDDDVQKILPDVHFGICIPTKSDFIYVRRINDNEYLCVDPYSKKQVNDSNKQLSLGVVDQDGSFFAEITDVKKIERLIEEKGRNPGGIYIVYGPGDIPT